MAVTNETIYIKADASVEIVKPEVMIGDVVTIECANPDIIPKIKTLKLLKFQPDKPTRCVVSILKVIACIHKEYPKIQIENLGEPDFIVTYEDQKTPNKTLHIIKVVCVICITFIGAAFSIMSFNNDVNVTKLFSQIYELLMGGSYDGFSVLELTYCIGLIIGILIFFNHFGGKKFTVDPTPMEVEMRLYENDIQSTLIENFERKGQELDVDSTNSSGRNRT